MVQREPGKFKQFCELFMKHFMMAQVSASAAVLAYYSLLSIFPAIIIVGNLMPMLGLDANTITSYLQTAIPTSIYQFIKPFIFAFLRRGSSTALTTGLLIALFSTSTGIAAFQRSVNHAYGVAENQNPVINRVVSFIWMIVVILILFVLILLYGLGEQVLKALQPIFGFSMHYIRLFTSLKWPITFTGLFIALTLLYYFVPNARVRLRYVLVGALLVTLTWMGLSRIFSYYTVVFSDSITSYKTIGAFIMMMIWLDFSGMVVMIGAVINATLQDAHEGDAKQRRYMWELIRDWRREHVGHLHDHRHHK